MQQIQLIQTICLDFPDFLVKLKKKTKKKQSETKQSKKTKKQKQKQTNNNLVWWDVNVGKSRPFGRTDQFLLQTRST